MLQRRIFDIASTRCSSEPQYRILHGSVPFISANSEKVLDSLGEFTVGYLPLLSPATAYYLGHDAIL